ncbi:MAG TPA: leucyl/phenylalanyl-tRNA--protein transferase [Myxococcota bacterium]|nr:leucyl/phenylalanyl-tRNA--protein transferase [Myxococcota bacterium]
MTPLYRLGTALAFPDPQESLPSGLLAVGGDLSCERLLLAYSAGIFPWYSEGDPILWHSPDPRMVLLPTALHVSHSLEKALRSGRYDVRFDSAFADVVRACAESPRPREQGTWITDAMQEAYTELHRHGYAHSVEAWEEGRLVGGLYGVSLGGAFFGESMFSARTDASKVALATLAAQLVRWRFDLIDCQMVTPHLARLGAEPWRRERFLEALARSLERPTRRGVWRREEEGA